MAEIVFDDSDFQRGIQRVIGRVEMQQIVALGHIADELLRLSQLEVPLDVGFLMQSGNTERDGGEYLVGYNTKYAARLHENPQFNFRNNRKGKYLEDPMKRNSLVFRQSFADKMGEVLR